MQKIKVEELAVLLDVSIQTINNWYRWKKLYPDNERAELLPDYIQDGPRKTRYWDRNDVYKLSEFAQTITRGRNGVMGVVTQRRLHKSKGE